MSPDMLAALLNRVQAIAGPAVQRQTQSGAVVLSHHETGVLARDALALTQYVESRRCRCGD